MLVNCYYYAPHNHTLLNRHLEADLEHIASMGADAISICAQETQLTNWHQQRLRNVVNLAHEKGLLVHVVPNRWAGLVAGWLDGHGAFVVENRNCIVCDADGILRPTSEWICCTQQPKVREHYKSTLKLMLERFDFDGLIWDEPHGGTACYCEHCRRLCPDVPTDEWAQQQTAAFFEEMSSFTKELRRNFTVSMFVQPHQRWLLQNLLQTRHIDYLGSDGHVRSEDHVMHRMKGTIFQAHAEFHPMLQAAGCKTMFLLEAQRHRDEDLDNFLSNVDAAFALPMDHLMYYYSAHEMSPKKAAMLEQATWSAVKRLKSRSENLECHG